MKNNGDEFGLEQEFEQYALIVKLTEEQEMTQAEISATFATIKNGFDLFKNLAKIQDEAKHAELIRAIAKMDLELAKLETELATKERELKDNK